MSGGSVRRNPNCQKLSRTRQRLAGDLVGSKTVLRQVADGALRRPTWGDVSCLQPVQSTALFLSVGRHEGRRTAHET